MKWETRLLRIALLALGISACTVNMQSLEPSIENYDLVFSTYIGGTDFEHARDVYADNQGNVYVVGGTASTDFPITAGAYDETFNTGGSQIGSAGPCDAFVMKFSPEGNLIWSSYLGGPNYDRAYAVEVNSQGYVYVAGRAGPGFPVTALAFQTAFQGVDAGIYGMQNAFVAKLSPDGSQLIWASYVGVGSLCRDLAIDSDGDVYVPLVYDGKGGNPPSSWFANAYQSNRNGGQENGAIKIKSDGSQVLWATWLGGSGDDVKEASIRVDGVKNVYLAFCTYSSDIPTTPGVHDRIYSGDGKNDFYVSKLTPDGSDLIYGTYIGGLGDQWNNTHNLAVDNTGNAYVAVTTGSDFPITSGVFQSSYGGGSIDWGVAKLSPTGALLASTFIGGNGGDNPDGIYVDGFGNVFITGNTNSTNFPVTGDAYQSSNHGGEDAVLVRLSADFSQLYYSTYMGGSSDDTGRAGFLGSDGSLYVTGSSFGPGWPVKNAFQSTFQGGSSDNILAKFIPTTSSLSVSASATPISGTAPLGVSFSGSASGGTSPYSYSWDFGDEGSSTEQNPSHTYSNPGTYTAMLTVTDSQSTQASDSLSITATSGTGTQQLSLTTATGAPASGSGGTTNPYPGTYSYPQGDSVPVEAMPNTDYRFSIWNGDVSANDAFNEQVIVNMDQDKSLAAFFCPRCGDVNGDLNVTASDAQSAFDIFLRRISNPTLCEIENSDVDCSGETTPGDAQDIFNKFIQKAELPSDCSGKTRAQMAVSPTIQTEQSSTMQLILEDTQVNHDGYAFIPIIVSNPLNIDAFGFDLQFPSKMLEFVTFEMTELLKHFAQVDAYTPEEGLLRFGGYGSAPLSSDSPEVLMSLVFRVKKSINYPVFLVITHTYDDIRNAIIKDGTIINRIEQVRDSVITYRRK